MVKKKLIAAASSAAMLATLGLAGNALATDRIEVKVTSEPMPEGTTCDKAGGFSMEFDEGTTLVDGDQITIDTPLNTSLCNSVDLLIAPANDANISGGTFSGTAWDNSNIPTSSSPVTKSGNVTGDGVVFWVHGNENGSRITLDVMGSNSTSSITVPDGNDDILAVKFLDQKTNSSFDQNGIWIDGNETADYVYESAAELADNTLCLDISDPDFGEITVEASLDSKEDKFTFIPSNPQIAHLVGATDYSKYGCTKAEVGYITLGAVTEGTQTTEASANCPAFDNESGSGYLSGCDVSQNKNNLIIQRADNTAFDSTNYTVEAEIMVNGVSGDNGVYFTSDAIKTAGYSTADDACNATNSDGSAIGAATYYQADGTSATPVAADTDCEIAGSAKAVKLTTAGDDLNLGSNDDFLYINLPQMHYDLDDVEADDEVSVKVTVAKDPCGDLTGAIEHEIGTFKSSSYCAEGTTYSLTYPYFTETGLGVDNYWDGFAITNLSSSAGTATVTMYEQDGDTATATVSVAANSMFVDTLSNMISSGDFTASSSNSGSLGDSRAYLVVTTDFNADGFAMIADPSTGESMGYLPRNNGNSPL